MFYLLDYWFIIKGCNNSGTAQWKRYIRHPKLTLCHRRYLFGLGNLRSFLKTKISVESESDLSMPFILQNNSFVHLKSTSGFCSSVYQSGLLATPSPFPPPLLDFFFKYFKSEKILRLCLEDYYLLQIKEVSFLFLFFVVKNNQRIIDFLYIFLMVIFLTHLRVIFSSECQ